VCHTARWQTYTVGARNTETAPNGLLPDVDLLVDARQVEEHAAISAWITSAPSFSCELLRTS